MQIPVEAKLGPTEGGLQQSEESHRPLLLAVMNLKKSFKRVCVREIHSAHMHEEASELQTTGAVP